MIHSLAQSIEVTCPDCGTDFTTEVWLIVDVVGRPDLLERIRAGTLHDQTCPHCDCEVVVDVPLLLYNPGQELPLLFSPVQDTTTEQNRKHAIELVSALRERLGDEWRGEWLARGLQVV